MKLLPLFVALSALLASGAAGAEADRDVPLGIEAVTGIRSDYVYRGFNLAGAVLDFQVESELALGRDFYLDMGGWFAAGAASDFSELSGLVDLRRTLSDRFSLGGILAYHSFDESLFRSGFDLGLYLSYFPADDWAFTAEARHDFAASGWYGNAEARWSGRLTDDAFLTVRSGLSVVDGYYQRSGFNDLHARASFTYNINRIVSVSPFLGGSVELLDGDGNELFAGLWFEVSF